MFGKILLIGAGAFGLSKVLKLKSTVNTADNLQFNPSKIKWGGLKSGSVNFTLTFDVINPTGADMVINFLFADINLTNGTKITSITKENWNFAIKKEAQTKVDVPVKIFFTDLIFLGRSLRQMLRDGKIPKALQAKGYIKVNKFTVPFDEIIDL